MPHDLHLADICMLGLVQDHPDSALGICSLGRLEPQISLAFGNIGIPSLAIFWGISAMPPCDVLRRDHCA